MKTQKVGQGMVALAFIVGLGLLTSFFAGVEERRYNPNQNPNSNTDDHSATVKLKRNSQGHYVVSGSINGKAALFLLDTGATDVVIPEKYAQTLGLKKGYRSRATTANGTITVYNTSLDQLKIGEIILYNVRASINPAMQGHSILLGMSALQQVEMLQRGDSLTLRQLY